VLPEPGASFAPEVRVHTLLRERGVTVPEIIYFEHCNEVLQRSVMVTTEIRGVHVGYCRLDRGTKGVLRAAGRELALINGVSVEGFGWIERKKAAGAVLQAEHETYRAFMRGYLSADLHLLSERVFTIEEIRKIRAIVRRFDRWFDTDRAWLAHGDFDVTHIYQSGGRYSGIIDFGEIRGAADDYDLGHFRMHDGETLPGYALPFLLEGYCEVRQLPADYERHIAFVSLLIAIRSLARRYRKVPQGIQNHIGIASVRRDIAVSEG
jgi:phosphotransferase family enzyme